jgi:peptidoglycan/xylan/chitin deacetylase (PgdA/CDA1 family)
MAGHGSPELPEGATSAISLAFDGGLVEHVELVAPLLAESGIRGTFFVTVPALLDHPTKWRVIAESGHELANHSHHALTHTGELPNWTRQAVREDLLESNRGIASITGYLPTSFAMSGFSTLCADGDYARDLVTIFTAIRTAEIGSNDVSATNPRDARALPWERATGEAVQLLPRSGEWTVPVFTQFFHPQFDAAEEDLRLLVDALRGREDIWVAPFGEVAAQLNPDLNSR